MSYGRIATYVHSDSITQNKGGCMIKVTTDTDFAARTDQFIRFCNKVAKFAYAAIGPDDEFDSEADVWPAIVAMFPDLGTDLDELRKALREHVELKEVVILKL